eukprot:4044690-Lingulodinium_polyedra.AAC.1
MACVQRVYDRYCGSPDGAVPAPPPQPGRPRLLLALSEALPAYIVDLTAVDRVRQQLTQAWIGARCWP